MEMVYFPISKIIALRRRAAIACRMQDEIPNGWNKSSTDPMKLLAVFKSLRIKPGFVLRAYQFVSGGNGNGIIWAMPIDAPFPEPMECSKLTDRFLEPPKPPHALDELMDAIDGDGTPRSYLSASIFAREAEEFGAKWHGCSWSTHTILAANPLQDEPSVSENSSKLNRPHGDPDCWTWNEPNPPNWEPLFKHVGDQVTISFLSYSGLGKEAIYRHRDSFRAGCYRFESHVEVIAHGVGGFVF